MKLLLMFLLLFLSPVMCYGALPFTDNFDDDVWTNWTSTTEVNVDFEGGVAHPGGASDPFETDQTSSFTILDTGLKISGLANGESAYAEYDLGADAATSYFRIYLNVEAYSWVTNNDRTFILQVVDASNNVCFNLMPLYFGGERIMVRFFDTGGNPTDYTHVVDFDDQWILLEVRYNQTIGNGTY